VLALRENTNPGWRATVDGKALRPIVLDGWQQGWVLPAGAATDVLLEFEPDRAYRAGIFVGGALALFVLLIALIPARRRDTRPRRPAPRLGRPILATAIGAVALASLGGLATIGVALGGLGCMLVYRALLANLDGPDRRVTRQAQRLMWRWLPLLLFVLAAVWSLLAEDRRSAVGPQLVALAVLSVLWLSMAVRAFRRRGHRAPAR
jgi:arabinofuranan 3-O-arabinosyltransferase